MMHGIMSLKKNCLQTCNKLNKSHLVGQLLNSILGTYKVKVTFHCICRYFAASSFLDFMTSSCDQYVCVAKHNDAVTKL